MSGKKKPKPRQRFIVYASDLNLRCKQFKPGTTERCTRPAVYYVPILGDTCDQCKRGPGAIRYADKPAVEAAA